MVDQKIIWELDYFFETCPRYRKDTPYCNFKADLVRISHEKLASVNPSWHFHIYSLTALFSFLVSSVYIAYPYFTLRENLEHLICFLNPFQNKPWFLPVCSVSLLKTSNFSFSHSVFYLFHKTFCHLIKFEIVVCKTFQFGRVQNLLFGKGLTPYQSWVLTTLKYRIFEKIVGNKENAGDQHFLLFPPCFLPYKGQKSSLEQHLTVSLLNK